MIRQLIDKLIYSCRLDTGKCPLRIIMNYQLRYQFYNELNALESQFVFTEGKYRGISFQFDLNEKLARVEL